MLRPASVAAPEILIGALSALSVTNLLAAVLPRASFAWPLEWMEGGVMQHALRLSSGQALYAAPAADWVPYLYPPLAYVPVAASLAVFGESFPAARLPSLVCTALGLSLVVVAGARASGRLSGGLAALSLAAMGYGYTGGFLDLARVDALFLLLVVGGTERLLAGRPRAGLLLLALSVLAKQHGLWFLLAASAHLAWYDRPRLRDVALAWALLAFAHVALEVASGGYYGRYTWGLPAEHGVLWSLFFVFFVYDLALLLPVPTLVAGVALFRRLRGRRVELLDALLVAALLSSALGRAHVGGHDNVRLPALWLLAIAGMAPLSAALCDRARARWQRVGVFAALCLQLAVLWQPPSLYRPTRASGAAFAALSSAMQGCGVPRERAVVLDYGLPGQRRFMHTMALSDLMLSPDSPLTGRAVEAFVAGLGARDAPALLVVGERFDGLDRALSQHYDECGRVPAPRPVVGHVPGKGGEQVLYRRR